MTKQRRQPISELRALAYQVDPALWVREQLKVTPLPWQDTFLHAPRGASIIALTARQVGKTTTAAWAIAHTAVFKPGSLSVIACPAQRQSGEAVRRTHGWIVADEAARLSENLIAALRPMRARRPKARLAMLSTAWSRTDPFWRVWSGDDPSWIKLKATADQVDIFSAEYLEQERRNLGEVDFKREYLGIPESDQASPFTWDLYDRATTPRPPLAPPGAAFRPRPEAPATELPNPFRSLKTTGVLS